MTRCDAAVLVSAVMLASSAAFNRKSLLSRRLRWRESVSFEYMHLEVNAQIWGFGSIETPGTSSQSILVDPFVGTLDFGLPNGLYAGVPKYLQGPPTPPPVVTGGSGIGGTRIGFKGAARRFFLRFSTKVRATVVKL